jgi:hypothetical protein
MKQELLEDYINKLYELLEAEDEENPPADPNTDVNKIIGIEPGKKIISREDLVRILKGKRGKMLTIAFRKKDGSLRILNTVTGVRKDITGAGLRYDPDKYGYIILYDLKAKGYRTVNINTIGDVRMDKQVFTVTEGANRSPIRFKVGGINLEGEQAWRIWKKWADFNRRDEFLYKVLNSIKMQNYFASVKQQEILNNWFNRKR